MSKKITIKDIATALNIHHSTVSRALRNDSRVKEETRKMISAYADEHGYQTNMIALELRGEKRNTIAIIVPNINHQFFSNIVSYITNQASDSGFVVSIFQSNETYQQEKNIIDTIIQFNFAGVIASLSMESVDGLHFNKFKKHNIPLVMFDRVSDDINVSKVVINNAEVLQDAVELLVNKGYNRIAHISGPPHLNVFGERQRGYKLAVKQFKLDYEKIITVNKGFSMEDGKVIYDKLFSDTITPNAIISDSSVLIYGLIEELRKKKIKIPSDVALMAFGENSIMEIIEPAITSIVQPDGEIATTAYNLLLKKIKGKSDNRTETIMLSATIKVRESI
ncbi:MAG: LacI family DNA-binding transcriptional regulator [Salinivirgaceae bacterium]|jgi:LacI family transcriptional regulator